MYFARNYGDKSAPAYGPQYLQAQVVGSRGAGVCFFVGWLLIVPATCECISGTDLLRQFDVLPH